MNEFTRDFNKLYKFGAKIIQTNTDGILIKIDNDKESTVMDLVKEWEIVTGLNMENEYVSLLHYPLNSLDIFYF